MTNLGAGLDKSFHTRTVGADGSQALVLGHDEWFPLQRQNIGVAQAMFVAADGPAFDITST